MNDEKTTGANAAKRLRLLVVEDSRRDAEIVVREIRRGGFDVTWKRVETEAAMRAALDAEPWEAIITDYRMPHFDGLAALRVLHEKGLDIPFIIVSGMIGEETAVAAMKVGAHDYLMKDKLVRLVPAIERELCDVASRRERHQAEAVLEASELRYRRLFESAKDGILILDAESGMVVDVNPFLIQLLGLSREAVLGKRIWELGFFGDIVANKESFAELQQQEYIRYEDKPLKTADGRRIDVEFVSNVYLVNHQKVIQCNIRDITERKRADAELLRNYETQAGINALLSLSMKDMPLAEFLASAFNLIVSLNWLAVESKGCIFLADEAGKLNMRTQRGMSDALLTMCSNLPISRCLCGRTAAERTLQYADCVDARHEIRYAGMNRHGHYCVPILSGDRVLGVLKLYVKDGHARDASEEDFLKAVANTLAGVIERKQVESERDQMQAQLLQSQKLESIGTLAGGVAHEINNPVMGIMNYAQLIVDHLGPDSPATEYAIEIGKETQRVATIVRNLLSFARVDKDTYKSPANLCDIVEETLSLIRAVMGHDQITLEVNVPADLPKILCRSQQIQQVLMNLMTNARDALNQKYPGHDKNKKIIVRGLAIGDCQLPIGCGEKGSQDSQSQITNRQSAIRLTVEDHGSGIPEELRQRIFNPFFSTKPHHKGTGLGLSISHGIVRDHGGTLSVESEVGQWTRFNVDLPVVDGEL